MSNTTGRSHLHRRLKKLETDQSLKANLLRASEGGARELLMERIRAIKLDREHGEKIPIADPEQVREMLSVHLSRVRLTDDFTCRST